jgi:RNA polymerase sigma factor (sigma-70 family)
MNDDATYENQLTYWWQQVLAGEPTALGLIHTALFDGLYNYALKLLDDTELAQDAVQELFIKIWVKRRTIGTIQKVKVYFFTALRRQLLNELRNLKLRRLKIKLVADADITFSQEEIIIENEEHTLLKQKVLLLLNTLPKRQREVVFLHYFQNLDYPEIARIMGIHYQSVLNLNQKALQSLRSSNFVTYCLLLYWVFLQKFF